MAIKRLPQETIQEASVIGSQGRDFKVGSAGELYTFELLKGLGLPRFGLDSWTSAIRDRVNLHADYHEIGKSKDRRAIADIEYADESRQSDATDMHLYLDPETKRRNQELEFSTHTWAVKPLMQPSMLIGNDTASLPAAQTTGAATEDTQTNRDIGTKAGDQESKVLGFGPFGSTSTDRTFGSSTPASQKQTVSPAPKSFLRINPTLVNASYLLRWRSFQQRNIQNTKPEPVFGSNAKSSNRDVSEATPAGGMLGSKSIFANDGASEASPTGNLFGKLASSDASKGQSYRGSKPVLWHSNDIFRKGGFGANVTTFASPHPSGPTGLFGAAPTSTESRPSQSPSALFGFGLSPFTLGASGSTKLTPAPGSFSSPPLFDFPSNSETASTSLPKTSTAESAPTAAGNGYGDESASTDETQSDDAIQGINETQSIDET
ncbi:MAG: hypothetical protein Q9207_000526 [Kuettlingeria erythrocarpa]